MSTLILHYRSLTSLVEALNDRNVTSQQICRHFLDETIRLNPLLQAFLSWDEPRIMAAAAASDQRRNAGKLLSRYDGIPIAVKDNISVTDERCSCASKILENFHAVYDATAIVKLKAMGMIPFGRANMDEFAMGSTCQNSAFGGAKNPWDVERIPGGSSGGSAVAVSAGLVPCALGSDTGGSIRQPASFCGVVGFKPGYGTVSRFGLVAFASSLDQIGPMANSVRDCATVYDMIAGQDVYDATSVTPEGFDPVIPDTLDLKGFRIGLPVEYFQAEGVDPAVRKVLDAAVARFKSLGAEIVDISIPSAKYCIAVYYILATAEASANLARFDGIRYGLRAETKDLLSLYSETREQGFGAEVKRRIILGTYVLSSGYYDAYYLRAQKVRTLIRDDFYKALEHCDCILSPVTPDLPSKINDPVNSDPLRLFLADVFTTVLNLSGGCGLSVPAGRDSETGLPVGIQLMSGAMNPGAVFKAGAAFEDSLAEKFVPNL